MEAANPGKPDGGGTYRTDTVKPFCPCDTGRPQDCKPEEWPGAHAEPPCLDCGRKRYTHFGEKRFCVWSESWPGTALA